MGLGVAVVHQNAVRQQHGARAAPPMARTAHAFPACAVARTQVCMYANARTRARSLGVAASPAASPSACPMCGRTAQPGQPGHSPSIPPSLPLLTLEDPPRAGHLQA